MFDQPDLEALLRTNLAADTRARVCAAASRSPTSSTTVRAGSASPTPTVPTVPNGRRRRRLRAGVRRRQQPHPRTESAPAWTISGSSSAGSSSTSPRRPTFISGTACTRCATRSGPAPTCASERRRYRWEFRLLDGETAADFADPRRARAPCSGPGCGRARRRTGAGARHRVHLPRAARRPLAPRPRLPSRRRRAPHPAVHRPGHGRRPARRDEPGVEAGGRTQRHPARRRAWTPTSRSESRTPAT